MRWLVLGKGNLKREVGDKENCSGQENRIAISGHKLRQL